MTESGTPIGSFRLAPSIDAAAAGLVYQALAGDAPSISPKYFYDRLGSMLFTAICELPEYYPTRTEARILPLAAAELATRLAADTALIDLGAGDCRKAAGLLPILGCPEYVALDISIEFLRDAVAALGREMPQLRTRALARDLMQSWTLSDADAPASRLMFYPGSSIGNFTPVDAKVFLQRVGRNAGIGGQLLIGVDLVKARAVLEAAYDDPLGVTSAFNLNALRHLNHLYGLNFDVSQWCHQAYFNEAQSRIEMHLESRIDQTVRWPGGERRFKPGSRIHTENSYKYQPDQFEALLTDAGWQVQQCWFDEQRWFAVFLAVMPN